MKEQNKSEAVSLIEGILGKHKSLSYSELRDWAESGRIDTREVKGQSGMDYQIELKAIWDDKAQGVVRFSGSIYDDSHSRIFKVKTPLTYDFLKYKG